MVWAEKIGLNIVATHFVISIEYEVIVTCENGGIGSTQLNKCTIKVLHNGDDITKDFLPPDTHAGKKLTGEDVVRLMTNIFKDLTSR